MFGLLDLILILAVFGFVLFGLWFGVVHTLGALVGTVAAAVIAGQYYTLAPGGDAGKVIGFILIFIVVNRLIGFIFYLVDRAFHFLTILPFLKSINRLAGGVLGLIEGLLVVGTALIVASKFNLGPWFTDAFTKSVVAPSIVAFAAVLLPLLPEALKKIQSFIPWVKIS